MSLRRVIVTGLLTALALVFNIVEGTMPLPLPGIKLGAANVFSLLALVLLGVREAFAVTLLRVCLAWLVTGNWFKGRKENKNDKKTRKEKKKG